MKAGLIFERIFDKKCFELSPSVDERLYEVEKDPFFQKVQFWFAFAARHFRKSLVLEISLAILLVKLRLAEDKNPFFLERLRILQVAVFSYPEPLQLGVQWKELTIASSEHDFLEFIKLACQLKVSHLHQPKLLSLLLSEVPFLQLRRDLDLWPNMLSKSVYFTDPRHEELAVWILFSLLRLPVEAYQVIVKRCLYFQSLNVLRKLVRLYIDWWASEEFTNFQVPLLAALSEPSSFFTGEVAERKPVYHARVRMSLALELLRSYVVRVSQCKDDACRPQRAVLQRKVLEPETLEDLRTTLDDLPFLNGSLRKEVREWSALHIWAGSIGYSFFVAESEASRLFGEDVRLSTIFLAPKVRSRSLPCASLCCSTILRCVEEEEEEEEEEEQIEIVERVVAAGDDDSISDAIYVEKKFKTILVL